MSRILDAVDAEIADAERAIAEFSAQLKVLKACRKELSGALKVKAAAPQKSTGKSTNSTAEGKQRPGPTGGRGRKPSALRAKVATWMTEHPAGTAAECGKALGQKPATVAYHMTQVRRAR